MDTEIQNAISELNENINDFVKNNEKQIKEIKVNMTKSENIKTMPLSENLDGDVYQKSDFADYIRKGMDVISKKSLSGKTEEEGGHLVPTLISMQINNKLRLLSPMRTISKIITISTNSIDILIDSKMPDAGWSSAASEKIDETASPEIKKIKIPVHEIYAKPKASQKLLDDSQINVEEWLTNKIAEKIAALENSAFVNGNGKDKPQGFLQCESDKLANRPFGKLQHFTTGAKGKFLDDNSAANVLVDMVCSIKPIYVKNAKWIMSRSALALIRKLKNSDGMSLWQPSLSESTPSTLLGYPVIIDDDMPTVVEGTASTSIAFGDFYAGYQIIDRQGLKILRDPYTSKPFVEFYATKRSGGAVVDFDAIKLLKFEA